MSLVRPRRSCPDCNGRLVRIRLIDRGEGYAHWEAGYAAAEAKRKLFGLGGYPLQGKLIGYLCGQCGRVLIYAEAKKGGAGSA